MLHNYYTQQAGEDHIEIFVLWSAMIMVFIMIITACSWDREDYKKEKRYHSPRRGCAVSMWQNIAAAFMLILVVAPVLTWAFTGYDCTSRNATKATISLQPPPECPPFEDTYLAPVQKQVQILQKTQYTKNKGTLV